MICGCYTGRRFPSSPPPRPLLGLEAAEGSFRGGDGSLEAGCAATTGINETGTGIEITKLVSGRRITKCGTRRICTYQPGLHSQPRPASDAPAERLHWRRRGLPLSLWHRVHGERRHLPPEPSSVFSSAWGFYMKRVCGAKRKNIFQLTQLQELKMSTFGNTCI